MNLLAAGAADYLVQKEMDRRAGQLGFDPVRSTGEPVKALFKAERARVLGMHTPVCDPSTPRPALRRMRGRLASLPKSRPTEADSWPAVHCCVREPPFSEEVPLPVSVKAGRLELLKGLGGPD